MFKSLFKRKETQLQHRVDFCISNLVMGSEVTYDALIERGDILVGESGCTSNCEICDYNMFALFNGEVIEAETAEELLTKINQEIADNPL